MSHYYFKIYPSFARRYKLSGNDLLIFSLIYSFSENDMAFYGTQHYIAGQLNIQRQTVNKSLIRLENMGILEKKRRGRQTVYALNVSIPSEEEHESNVSTKHTHAVRKTNSDMSTKRTPAVNKTYTNHTIYQQYDKRYNKETPSFDLSKESDFSY